MSDLQRYIVIYTTGYSVDWQFFACHAEDGDHAEEQCVNAYPGCGVVGVYLASSAAEALARMTKELGWGA